MKKMIAAAAIAAAPFAADAHITVVEYCVDFSRAVEAGAKARDRGYSFEQLREPLYRHKGPLFARVDLEAFLDLMFTHRDFIAASPKKLRGMALSACLEWHGGQFRR